MVNVDGLVFQDPPELFGLSSGQGTLYIRDCWSDILTFWLGEKSRRPLTIISNPGDGATCFIAFVLYNLTQFKADASLIIATEIFPDLVFCKKPHGPLEVSKTFWDFPEIQDPSTFLLCDSRVPPAHIQASTLISCSSNDKSLACYIDRYVSNVLYMPSWSNVEMLKVSLLIGTLDHTRLQLRCRTVGNCPKLVFHYTTNFLKCEIDDELSKMPREELLKLQQGILHSGANKKLVHCNSMPEEFYRKRLFLFQQHILQGKFFKKAAHISLPMRSWNLF